MELLQSQTVLWVGQGARLESDAMDVLPKSFNAVRNGIIFILFFKYIITSTVVTLDKK